MYDIGAKLAQMVEVSVFVRVKVCCCSIYVRRCKFFHHLTCVWFVVCRYAVCFLWLSYLHGPFDHPSTKKSFREFFLTRCVN